MLISSRNIHGGMDAVFVEGLEKSYGEVRAVNGISFSVPEGSFFAFLGPNGAGKSTTISIIISLLKADAGKVSIFGKDPEASRSDIGVVFQDPKMDPLLTVRENVTVRGSMYGLGGDALKEAVQNSIDATDCTEFADRRYGQLSGGQRRRADIARAMVHSPRLLILDEPTTGLDPMSRSSIWELIRGLNASRGITVMLTTHYMEEAADADDIVIINRGTIVAHGTPSQLRDSHCHDTLTFVSMDPSAAEALLESRGAKYASDKGVFTVSLSRTADAVPIIAALGDNILSLEVRSGTLDEAFIEITGAEE